MNREHIYEEFVKNFIIKERRQRCLFELMNPVRRNEFIHRLSHQTKRQFITDRLTLIPKHVELPKFITEHLKISKAESCYIISMEDELDDRFMNFSEAFEKSYGIGFPSLIITLEADKIYLTEEQSFGPPDRYIGNA